MYPPLDQQENRAMQSTAWTASALLDADADAVLEALTDPDRIAEWAPVGFDLDDAGRLCSGARTRVRGTLAGLGATFEVEVVRADEDGLELVARGPIELDVEYLFETAGDGVHVDARVAIRRRPGLTAKLLEGAASGLLGRGALDSALRRLDTVVCGERELIAA
jgi:Polyketide cyclase / dehydrase and lipid transport